MRRFWAIVKLRCPKCCQGKVFVRWLTMHEACPHCGASFHREPGYFLGAMYFSYGLGILSCLPLGIWLFSKGVDSAWIGLAAVAQLALLSPFLVRYSRVMWMHWDQRFDPR